MKTNILCRALLILLVFIIGFGFAVPSTEASTEIGAFVSSDLHLIKDNSPYVVTGDTGLHFDSGHTLTIDPGVTLLLSSGWLYIDQANLVIGNASSKEKVVIDKKPGSNNWSGIYLNTSKAVIDSLEIKNANTPIYSWYGDISLKNSSIDGTMQGFMSTGIYAMEGNLNIASTTLSNFQNKAIYANNTKGTINKSIISENGTGIFYDGEASANFSGTENKFVGNNKNIYNANNATTLDFRGNDWGTGGAPVRGSVVGKVLTGFEEAVPCCSSVVFIPGLMATRLHLGDNQLWEPNRNADVEKLYLDSNGNSVNSSIQVGEIIDKTNSFGIIGSKKIYQSFVEDMNSLVGKGKIDSWVAIPYDWRLDINSSMIESMIPIIEKTASSSYTKKVTIVTHSNGGLVAKHIINYLKNIGKENLVDNLIMVATPQVGTPSSVSGLFHGDDQDLLRGLVLNKKNARKWGENMPVAYNLLPSIKYLDTVKTPLVYFDSSIDKINKWRSLYGDSIDSWEDFESFALGDDGRVKPSADDLGNPNILNNVLLSQSQNTHLEIDNFSATHPFKIHQIAGWGRSTPLSVKYFTTSHCGLSNFFCIGNSGLGIDHENVDTFDGDGTVVSPSVVLLKEANNYYLNLNEINNNLSKNFSHSNIFEVPNLLGLLDSIIIGSSTDSIAYVTKEKPDIIPFKNIEISIHSPADIHVYDQKGNHTGIVINPDPNSDLAMFEETIPNSSYQEIGEGKYIAVQNSDKLITKVQGYAVGTFTLNIKETKNGIQNSIEFVDIPVTDVTKAEVRVSSDFSSTTLALDYNGDNKVDFVIKPNSELDPILYLNILKQNIALFKLKPGVESNLVKKIDKVIKFITKDKQKVAIVKLNKLSAKLSSKNWKTKKISESERIEITNIINEIIDSIQI